MPAVLSQHKLNQYFELLLCSLFVIHKINLEKEENLNIILFYKVFSAVLICFVLVFSLKLKSKRFL